MSSKQLAHYPIHLDSVRGCRSRAVPPVTLRAGHAAPLGDLDGATFRARWHGALPVPTVPAPVVVVPLDDVADRAHDREVADTEIAGRFFAHDAHRPVTSSRGRKYSSRS